MSVEQQVDTPDALATEQAKESAAQPKLLRSFFQFRLLALLLLVIPMAFAAIQVRNWLDDRPVDWKPYSKAELDQHVRDEETVLVFMTEDHEYMSVLVEEKVFASQRVRQVVRSRGIVAMRSRYGYTNNRSPELLDLVRSTGQTMTTNILIYSTQSRGQPIVLNLNDRETIEQRLYSALEENSSRW